MWDSLESAVSKLKDQPKSHWQNYLGFYSSWLGGYFKEPWAMSVPMDDHGFHRGDGVFEAARIHERAYFDLDSHLNRLQNSARLIGMELPWSIDQIRSICVELARRCNADSGILRLYVTRGPGGFSPDPRETLGPQLYAAITRMISPPAEKYTNGCRALLSTVRAKDPWYSRIKSLNYLQNVLMKKECRDQGYDIPLCANAEGVLAEGATENLMIITADFELVVPKFDYTLKGTTVSLVMRLAEENQKTLGLKAVRLGDVRIEDLKKAKEAAFVGTTLGVLPISSLNDEPVAGGRQGPICAFLNKELLARMAKDPKLRTSF